MAKELGGPPYYKFHEQLGGEDVVANWPDIEGAKYTIHFSLAVAAYTA
jgi:hypothetical protein